MQLVNGSQLRFCDPIRAPKVEQSRASGSGALRLAPLNILEDCIDFLLTELSLSLQPHYPR